MLLMKPSTLTTATVTKIIKKFQRYLFEPIDTASLVFFRIAFGLLMFFSIGRFIAKGWIEDFYITPLVHFPFEGFYWLSPWPGKGMYFHFYVLLILSLFISLGLFYRVSTILFFLGFTYVELLDKTYYLNHYYAISLFSLIIIFLPLNKSFSLDILLNPNLKTNHFPRWTAFILQFQISVIYFFAGLAKLNTDWLIHAQPLKIWLSNQAYRPVISYFLSFKATPYIMSICGAIYDLFIPFFLFKKRTRSYAYLFVLFFHFMTALFFSIGVFPWVMMVLTLVYFEPDWPRKLMKLNTKSIIDTNTNDEHKKHVLCILGVYIFIQIILPFRYLCYQGPLFWREEGFRFSWRVMLMEKNGMIEFRVKDVNTNKEWLVSPLSILTPLQYKYMATQADMIIQFAHVIQKQFKEKGYTVEVYAKNSFVALNGRRSKPFIKEDIDLSKEAVTLKPYEIIHKY